jgi:glycerophosphoryl diester phosphodiesterase
MKLLLWIFVSSLSLAIVNASAFAQGMGQKKPLVIAHRGASAYLPEHSLAGAAMAHAMGADYIELDLVLSKDSKLIVNHDITLKETTDVESIFPVRKRPDGKWYVIDFTLGELKTLKLHERTKDDKGTLNSPGRFPYGKSSFQISTFEEMVELIQGMNKTTDRKVGVYSELKDVAFHQKEGRDLLPKVIKAHTDYGYIEHDSGAVLQSFDQAALKRLRSEFKTKLPLIQLIGGSWAGPDHAGMKTGKGIAEIAQYANGIGPAIKDLFLSSSMTASPLAEEAKKNKLVIHTYTLRADQLPQGVTFDFVVRGLLAMEVNGIFTDNPDLLRAIVP